MVVRINSEERIYKWRGNGLFCRELQPGVKECITNLGEGSYEIFVREDDDSGKEKICYRAINHIVIVEGGSPGEEIIVPL